MKALRAAALLGIALLTACANSGAAGVQSAPSIDPNPGVLPVEWYLPKNFTKTEKQLVISSGVSAGVLYAHSSALAVRPGATYEVSAKIDARGVTGGRPCFYAAAMPSGQDLGIECARPATSAHYTIRSLIPPNVTAVQWVAMAKDLRIASGKTVTLTALELHELSAVAPTADLLSK